MHNTWIERITYALQVATLVILLVAGVYFLSGVGLIGLVIFFPRPGAYFALLPAVAWMGIAGYGLYALGWLTLRAQWIELRGIPWKIRGGLGCGAGLAAWIVVSDWLVSEHPSFLDKAGVFDNLVAAVLATLLACVGLLAMVALRELAARSAAGAGSVE